jgi:hypothetical protein
MKGTTGRPDVPCPAVRSSLPRLCLEPKGVHGSDVIRTGVGPGSLGSDRGPGSHADCSRNRDEPRLMERRAKSSSGASIMATLTWRADGHEPQLRSDMSRGRARDRGGRCCPWAKDRGRSGTPSRFGPRMLQRHEDASTPVCGSHPDSAGLVGRVFVLANPLPGHVAFYFIRS